MARVNARPCVVHLVSADLWAGAEVATFHLLRALAERGDLEVRALLLNPGELERRLREARIPVAVEPESGRGFASLAVAVRRQLRDADLVHAHRYKEDVLAALSGRPWVASRHGRPEPSQGAAAARSRLYQWLDLWALRRSARRTIAVSSEVESWLARRIGAGRVVKVWNGIADPAAGLDVPSWAERPLRVGALGRLFPVKAFGLAIDAVAACPGLELEIAGDGPERAGLQARIADSGASDRIRLLGHVADPHARIASWRALLVTSLHEGNPIGVIEALALGTPVVSADLAGVAEILEGQGGRLVASRAPAAWAALLQPFVSDPQTARVSAAARRRYESAFTAAAAAERMHGVYREILERPA